MGLFRCLLLSDFSPLRLDLADADNMETERRKNKAELHVLHNEVTEILSFNVRKIPQHSISIFLF